MDLAGGQDWDTGLVLGSGLAILAMAEGVKRHSYCFKETDYPIWGDLILSSEGIAPLWYYCHRPACTQGMYPLYLTHP